MTLFAELGGEEKLRWIINAFVDRVFDDLMIGFLFRNSLRDRIKNFEYQHAAKWLGADVAYEGRALDAAHRRFEITGGQFARRLQILREVLDECEVPPHIRDAWLQHQESLRILITADPDSRCHSRDQSG